MQMPHLVLLGVADHVVLDRVDLVADRLDRQEIAVDQRIDQRIGEVVGLARPQAVGVVASMRLRTGLNGSPGALLEGDDEVLAEENG